MNIRALVCVALLALPVAAHADPPWSNSPIDHKQPTSLDTPTDHLKMESFLAFANVMRLRAHEKDARRRLKAAEGAFSFTYWPVEWEVIRVVHELRVAHKRLADADRALLKQLEANDRAGSNVSRDAATRPTGTPSGSALTGAAVGAGVKRD